MVLLFKHPDDSLPIHGTNLLKENQLLRGMRLGFDVLGLVQIRYILKVMSVSDAR
jgi:hypothetical protein